MNNNILFRILNYFKNADKEQGLKCAVIVTWIDFPLLYWGITVDNLPVIIAGIFLLILGNSFALYFG